MKRSIVDTRPRIGLTLGDPAGIGPEIVLRLLQCPEITKRIQPIVYGDLELLRRVAVTTGIDWPEQLVTQAALASGPWNCEAPALLLDYQLKPLQSIVPGQIQQAAGAAAATWIQDAARDALNGRIRAMTTGPINKQSVALAGVPYPGHTEWLAALSHAGTCTMLFMAPDLAVSLATIHLPLSEAPTHLTTEGILKTIRRTAAAISRRLGRQPRIGVLALNPHAGEGGRFGKAESELIAPAIAAARKEGIDAAGPLVPDTAFVDAHRKKFDAFVAMYHDQGLIPFKMLAFDLGVNVTLGLPFIRTSVDHGTAFDISWQGKASAESLRQALILAADLSAK